MLAVEVMKVLTNYPILLHYAAHVENLIISWCDRAVLVKSVQQKIGHIKLLKLGQVKEVVA